MIVYIIVVVVVLGAAGWVVACVVLSRSKRQRNKNNLLNQSSGGGDGGVRHNGSIGGGGGGIDYARSGGRSMTTNPLFDSTVEATSPRPVTIFEPTDPTNAPGYYDVADPSVNASSKGPRRATVYSHGLPHGAVVTPAPEEYGKMNTAATYAAPTLSRTTSESGPNAYSRLDRDTATA